MTQTLTTTEELKHLASSDNANELTRRLARELLANREAQPVAYLKKSIIDSERFDSADPEIILHPNTPEGWLSEYQAVFTAPPAAVADAVRQDAERWRALLASARIRILGTAGFTPASQPGVNGPSNPDYRHFGVEFWTHHPGWLAENNEYAINTLTQYADTCRAAMLASAPEGGN
ncbi:hypothetical protein I5N01_05495 [Serratia marcescens]|nr:hypothetical protein [Serratia marcescens]